MSPQATRRDTLGSPQTLPNQRRSFSRSTGHAVCQIGLATWGVGQAPGTGPIKVEGRVRYSLGSLNGRKAINLHALQIGSKPHNFQLSRLPPNEFVAPRWCLPSQATQCLSLVTSRLSRLNRLLVQPRIIATRSSIMRPPIALVAASLAERPLY